MKITTDVVATLAAGAVVWYAWDPELSAACRAWVEDLDWNGRLNSYVVDETITRESLLLAAHEHDRRVASAFYTEREEAIAHLVASRGWVDRGDRDGTEDPSWRPRVDVEYSAPAMRETTIETESVEELDEPIPAVEAAPKPVAQMGLFA